MPPGPTTRIGPSAYRRPSFHPGWILAVLVATVAAAVVLAVARETDLQRLAPCNEAAGQNHAALLFDATKPLDSAALAVLRDIGPQVSAGRELRVHALVDDADEPEFVGALCRPYHVDALDVAAAKDGHAGRRHCDDLPAQLAPDLRAAAARYCAERADLAARLEALAGPERRVEGAYLMEAVARLLRGPGLPDPLFVASDMLQHAPWYSHLDLDWTEWGFEHFQVAARAHGMPVDASPLARIGHRIRVLYVPRQGLTDAVQVRDAHWSFWRAYFGEAALEFDERRVAAGYAVAARMDLDAALGEVARERAAIRQERTDASRTLDAILQETAVLAAEQRSARAVVDDLERRVAAVRRDRLAAEAEERRMQAEAADRRDPRAGRIAPAAAEVALSPARPAEALAPATCALHLLAPFDQALTTDRYVDDGAANYGAGVVVVRYAVGAGGKVLDDGLAIDAELSGGSRPEHLATLADDALETVRGWRFAVDCGPAGSVGVGGQQASATFTYRQKCVGAPIPRCRTAFGGASPQSPQQVGRLRTSRTSG